MAIEEQKAEEAAGQRSSELGGGSLYLGAAHFDGNPSQLLPAASLRHPARWAVARRAASAVFVPTQP